MHRIGRTGRAGETGFAVSFVSPEQQPWLKDIEKLIKKTIPEMELANFDPAQAEADAAARATRAAGRRDPELAAAAAEYAKTQKKRAAQSAHEPAASDQARAGKNTRKKTRTPGQPPVKTNQKAVKPQKAKPSQPKPSQKKAAGKAQAGSKQSSSTPKRSGSDMRPGRAHRAAVAKRRSR